MPGRHGQQTLAQKVRRNDLPVISSDWRPRLERAFEGILSLEESESAGTTITAARSPDSKTSLEVMHRDNVFLQSQLRVTLPQAPDDIVLLKLGCWTLLFFRALLPEWKEAECWLQEAAVTAAKTAGDVVAELPNIRIACQYAPAPRLLTYQVVASKGPGFAE